MEITNLSKEEILKVSNKSGAYEFGRQKGYRYGFSNGCKATAKQMRCQPINIIFDGPPEAKAGRFVDSETDDGKPINTGEWIERADGLWSLRITELPKED